WRSDPVAPPRRRRNTPGDLPATTRAGSAATGNLAQAGRRGRLFPCSETWHIEPVSFNLNQRLTVEYSDTLLEQFAGVRHCMACVAHERALVIRSAAAAVFTTRSCPP